MNPGDPCVQIIARTVMNELDPLWAEGEEDEPLPEEAIKLARAVLWDLAHEGIRLVHPDDVLENETSDKGIKLLLRTE